MLSNIKRKMRKDEEEGFTLIELLVVVLILGILMAIAIPTFLSLTSGAKTSAAESDLTTAAQDEATQYTQNGTYGANAGANVALMQAIDSGINWSISPGAAGTKTVQILTAAPGAVLMATIGADTNVYWIQDTAGTLRYAKTVSAVTAPVAADFTASTAISWSSLPATALGS